MKKRISDLLNTYQDDSVELSGPTPLSSARIKELTMNRIAPKKHTLRRLPVRLLAAAAIIAVLTASAMAVNYVVGAGGLMQGFFAHGGALSTGQLESLDQIGRTFGEGVTSNGATITPIAALADENCYYLRLRIEAPEGTVLPDLNPDVEGFYQLQGRNWPEEKMTFTGDDGEDIRGNDCRFEWQPDSDPTDNVKEVVVRYVAYGIDRATFNKGESKVLTIRGLWIQSPYKEYTPVFTGDFALDVSGTFEQRTMTVDCGGADYRNQTGYGHTMWMDQVKLTPLSVSVQYRDNVDPRQNSSVSFGGGVEGLQIVLKDGTVFFDSVPWWEDDAPADWDPAAMLKDSPVNSREGCALFDQPLDLDQVDYLKFGEHIIPVNAE